MVPNKRQQTFSGFVSSATIGPQTILLICKHATFMASYKYPIKSATSKKKSVCLFCTNDLKAKELYDPKCSCTGEKIQFQTKIDSTQSGFKIQQGQSSGTEGQ